MQLSETNYNAIAKTLNLFGLNPTYVRSLSPEDCKQILEVISHHYVENEKLSERVVSLDFEEYTLWSKLFHSDGCNLIFFNQEELKKKIKLLDEAIPSFYVDEVAILNIVRAIRDKLSEVKETEIN